MQSDSYISSVAWVHKGYAAHVPKQIELTEQQMAQIKQDPMIAEQLHPQAGSASQMEEEDDDLPAFGQNFMEVARSGSKYPAAIEDISDDEKEDYYIKDSDALIVAGKIEKQYASLEVYVFEQDKNNLYVHHQIMLSAFPLDIQWLKVSLGSINSNQPTKGNYAIVASFLPQIQIWNLDLTEAIQPDLILGGEVAQSHKKPKKFTNRTKRFKPGSHTDSVTSLSLNQANLGVLASGSVDSTVKVWDMGKQVCVHTASHHQGPIKKVEWNSVNKSEILAAGEDQAISVLDSRYPDGPIFHKSKHSIQSATWNPNQQFQIAYVTDNGQLHLYDVRMGNKLLASIQAHTSRGNDVKIGRKNICYTCSEDETVRAWNLHDFSKPLAVKHPKCGVLMCLDLLDEDEGPVLTAGNSKGELFVWDTTENEQLASHWANTQ